MNPFLGVSGVWGLLEDTPTLVTEQEQQQQQGRVSRGGGDAALTSADGGDLAS